MSLRYPGLVLVLFAPLALAACQTDYYAAGNNTYDIAAPLDTKYFPSDEPYKAGVQHFNEGNFGLAQRYFQAAVEKTPRDSAAWVGLAASYDRIRRFDLADHAYAKALALSGPTIQILNNQGYSFMLRGDFKTARAKFLAAYELDPENPYIKNNIELLSQSAKMVERHEPAY